MAAKRFTIDDISERPEWEPNTTYLWYELETGEIRSGHVRVREAELDDLELRQAIVEWVNERTAEGEPDGAGDAFYAWLTGTGVHYLET